MSKTAESELGMRVRRRMNCGKMESEKCSSPRTVLNVVLFLSLFTITNLWTGCIANDEGTLDVQTKLVRELEGWECCVKDLLVQPLTLTTLVFDVVMIFQLLKIGHYYRVQRASVVRSKTEGREQMDHTVVDPQREASCSECLSLLIKAVEKNDDDHEKKESEKMTRQQEASL